MRFIGAVVAWIFASVVTHVLAVSAAQLQTLGALAADGAPLSFGMAMGFLWDSLLGGVSFLGIVAIGFAVAFYVAKLVKSVVTILAPVAYPVAGGAAMASVFALMVGQFGLFPIRGANLDFGLIYQIGAGVIGGISFEVFRPKRD